MEGVPSEFSADCVPLKRGDNKEDTDLSRWQNLLTLQKTIASYVVHHKEYIAHVDDLNNIHVLKEQKL